MIKLFADGADFDGIVEQAKNYNVVGFTTNPTLMRQAGITDYKEFAQKTIKHLVENRPKTCLSLEVFADDHFEMLKQARHIASWGEEHNYQVYVKIPVTNTRGESSCDLIRKLSEEKILVNVTAVFTFQQVVAILDSVDRTLPTIISIFAGRIADAGHNPKHTFNSVISYYEATKGDRDKVEFLWASPREVYNYRQAEQCGVDIITMTPDLIKKLSNFGKDLNEFSLDTVKMFYNDALKSGYTI